MQQVQQQPHRYRRIILHAGLHKTGSTSIQNNCFKYREMLLEHGIYYPVFSFRQRQLANHSDPITGAICAPPRLYGMPRRMQVETDPAPAQEAFSSQFEQVLNEPRADTLLLSAELVCDYGESDMQVLARRLSEKCDELQVIAFVRSPASSLESMLQQRNINGNLMDPRSLLGVVSQRYGRLANAFPGILQIHNFHEAVVDPDGLVGYFLRAIGVPREQFGTLDFGTANERVSLEAHRLIEAINRAFPADGVAGHGIARSFLDIKPLLALPGQPFQLEAFRDSELYEQVAGEGRLLEQQLGFAFPASVHRQLQPLWQGPTLMELEAAASKLENPLFRITIADYLEGEAAILQPRDAATAAVLDFVAARVRAQGEAPPVLLLEQLGADYFKYAALQLERVSPEMALQLMSLALHLRPEAEFINERVEHYREKLAKK